LSLGSLTGPLQAINGAVSASSTLSSIFGGTGFSSYTAGDILYANSSGNLTKLPIGSDGLVLKVSSGIPSWQADQTSSGGGPPPLKTELGWLLFYHAIEKKEPDKYKLGAMILDKDDPTKVLYRSNNAILYPEMWYENDGKPGVVYASGSVIRGDDVYIYYGGGDRVVCAAKTNLKQLLDYLRAGKQAISNDEEVVEEIRLALMDAGRKTARYIIGKEREKLKQEKKHQLKLRVHYTRGDPSV
jgi:hypothetical protein